MPDYDSIYNHRSASKVSRAQSLLVNYKKYYKSDILNYKCLIIKH